MVATLCTFKLHSDERDWRPVAPYEREDSGKVAGLREPGRGFCQNLLFHLELFVLTAQTSQFGSFFGGQAFFTPVLVPVVLLTPSCGWLAQVGSNSLDRASQAAAGANEVDHLLT